MADGVGYLLEVGGAVEAGPDAGLGQQGVEQDLDRGGGVEGAVVAALERHGRGAVVAQPAEECCAAALDEVLVADHVVGGQVACEAGEEPVEDEELPSQAVRGFVVVEKERRIDRVRVDRNGGPSGPRLPRGR